MKGHSHVHPVSFELDRAPGYFLFSDAFITQDPYEGRRLVLISTYYPHMPFDFAEVVVTLDGVRLNRFDDIGRDEHEPERAVIYPLDYLPEADVHQMEVRYHRQTLTTQITPDEPEDDPTFSLATLFKDDFENVEACYHHYKNQGVERFYLFYNARIARLPKPLFTAPDIVYGEWNFPYWLDTADGKRHHAQAMFLTMVRYRLLPRCSYLALVDLDEFLAVRGEPGVTLREHVESHDEEVLLARCYWSEIRNPGNAELRELRARLAEPRGRVSSRERALLFARITADDLGFLWANPQHEGDARTKAIYRGDFRGLCGVHKPKLPAVAPVAEALALYHIVNTPHGRFNLISREAARVSLH